MLTLSSSVSCSYVREGPTIHNYTKSGTVFDIPSSTVHECWSWIIICETRHLLYAPSSSSIIVKQRVVVYWPNCCVTLWMVLFHLFQFAVVDFQRSLLPCVLSWITNLSILLGRITWPKNFSILSYVVLDRGCEKRISFKVVIYSTGCPGYPK